MNATAPPDRFERGTYIMALRWAPHPCLADKQARASGHLALSMIHFRLDDAAV